jgi:hypothetical protein
MVPLVIAVCLGARTILGVGGKVLEIVAAKKRISKMLVKTEAGEGFYAASINVPEGCCHMYMTEEEIKDFLDKNKTTLLTGAARYSAVKGKQWDV